MRLIHGCMSFGLLATGSAAFAFNVASIHSLSLQQRNKLRQQTPFSSSKGMLYDSIGRRDYNQCSSYIKRYAKTKDEINEEENLTDIEWGDDDIDASIPSYSDCLEQLQAFVFLCEEDSDNKKEYVASAQEVFDEMIEWYMTEDIEELKPTVDIYNLLIQLYCMVNDFDMAQGILSRMEEQEEESDMPPPNLDTYLTTLSYAQTSLTTPQTILSQIQELYEKDATTFEHLCPTTELCNSILYTYTKRESPEDNDTSPWSKIKIMETFLDTMKDEDRNFQPDVETYNIIMSYIAKCTGTAKGGQRNGAAEKGVEMVQNLFNKVTLPDAKSYNALVKAYANTHTLEGAKKAEEILVELASSYKEQPDNIRPNPASFVNAIYGWRNIPKQMYEKGDNTMCADRALKLLQLMEELALFEDGLQDQKPEGKEERETLWPDVRVYNAVLHVISRSTHPRKVQLARDLLAQMRDSFLQQEDRDTAINHNNDACPNTRSYNNVLNACAFLSSGRRMKEVAPQEKMDAFRVAVETFNNIRSDASLLSSLSPSSGEPEEEEDTKEDSIKADHVTYGLFLRCCGTLLPTGEKRDAVIENVFRKCCNDGLVSDFVLESFSRAASDKLSENILGSRGGSSSFLPMEWSVNVL